MRALLKPTVGASPFREALAEAVRLERQRRAPGSPLKLNAAGWRRAAARLATPESVDALAAALEARPSLARARGAVHELVRAIADGAGRLGRLSGLPKDPPRWRWVVGEEAAAELASVGATRETAVALAVRQAVARGGDALTEGVPDVTAASEALRDLDGRLDALAETVASTWTVEDVVVWPATDSLGRQVSTCWFALGPEVPAGRDAAAGRRLVEHLANDPGFVT